MKCFTKASVSSWAIVVGNDVWQGSEPSHVANENGISLTTLAPIVCPIFPSRRRRFARFIDDNKFRTNTLRLRLKLEAFFLHICKDFSIYVRIIAIYY